MTQPPTMSIFGRKSQRLLILPRNIFFFFSCLLLFILQIWIHSKGCIDAVSRSERKFLACVVDWVSAKPTYHYIGNLVSEVKNMSASPNFYCKTQKKLHHIAIKRGVSYPDVNTKYSCCEKEPPSYYTLQKHKHSEHGKRSQMRNLIMDLDSLMNDQQDLEQREVLTTCKQFLVVSELVGGGQQNSHYASKFIDPTFLRDTLQLVCETLQCAAKIELALEIVLRNVEDGKDCYFYEQGKLVFPVKSRLFDNNEDLLELRKIVDILNIAELSAGERSSTKWKLFATNVTFLFAALLKSVPVGCKQVAIPPHLVKGAGIICLTWTVNMEQYNNFHACWGLFSCTGQVQRSWRKKRPITWMKSSKSIRNKHLK